MQEAKRKLFASIRQKRTELKTAVEMTGYGHRGKPKAGFPRLPTALGNRWRDSHIPTAATRRAMEKWKAQKRAFPLSHGTTGYGSLNSKSKRRPGGGASLPLQAHRSIRKCCRPGLKVTSRAARVCYI